MARPDPAVCKHGILHEEYCRACEDEMIERAERRSENLPEMEPDPAVCEHGIPQGQYCAPCDDDYIARQEASPVGQPAQPPRWVQPELF